MKISKEASFVELTGGSSVHRHMTNTEHTLGIRHMRCMLCMLQLERSCHTLVWVLGTMDKNTSGYLLDMVDTLEGLWEVHMQGMRYMWYTLYRLYMWYTSDMLQISHMAVDIEDTVDTVQMVRTMGMHLHKMLDTQLKMK